MKWLLTFLLMIGLALSFVLISQEDTGFVVLNWNAWTVETTLTVFIMGLLATWFVLDVVVRLLMALWSLPKKLARRHAAKKQYKADEELISGTLDLLQQNWEQAEQRLTKVATYSVLPSLHYLGAAYAAHQQDKQVEMANYFDAVREHLPVEHPASFLFQAKLQLAQQNFNVALENALAARQLAPKNTQVIETLLTIYAKLSDWELMLKILADIRKQKVLSDKQFQMFNIQAVKGKLAYDLDKTSAQDMPQIWEKVSNDMRLQPEVLHVYTQYLTKSGMTRLVETVLYESLQKKWQAEVITWYGKLHTSDTLKQIAHAETWLKSHYNDADLLLALGRLCLREKLLDKAEKYLKNSVNQLSANQQPNPLAYQILGDVLMQMNKFEEAGKAYQQALTCMSDQ